MKKTIVPLLLSSVVTPAAAADCLDLAWTIPHEYMAFDAVMEEAGPHTKISMNFDHVVEDEEARTQAAKAFEDFEFPKETSMTAVVTPSDAGTLDFKMVMGGHRFDTAAESEQAKQMRKMMEAMAGTVQLRGEIDTKGRLVSFYLPQRQKNLANIFFELPAGCVEIGDEWSLDLNLVELDQNFVEDKSNRHNVVKLVDIEKRGGTVIAVMDYFVMETAAGTFNVPTQDKSIPTEMSMGYTGRGYFNVTEGRWEQLAGTISIESSGVMTANSTQLLALRPRNHVEDAVLNAR